MSSIDPTTTRGPRDSVYVGIDLPEEFLYWLEHFEVAPAELGEAVRAVGHNVKDVEFYLNRKRILHRRPR